ncbi:LPXTG cell wall anchor domain-containing protein [Microbacterium sp. Marseille-Q6965]|uniref:LPXTG cell wall anchor domain-containing protein n=1 Tax=Microbacterium sp. Marseille-Q6965 TaxID=2965072 RepID=UPI0021B7D761|nr:LPXTG cell wall anchor domain-containing protein [Microbacterium sp. Marseille-Q6965]
MIGAATVALLLGPGSAAGVDDGLYAPYQPPGETEPSLNATAHAECIRDAPWIFYDVTLVDPDGLATSNDVSLVFSEGAERVAVPLGTLGADNTLSGSVLWPGAGVDESGTGVQWPGWVTHPDGSYEDVGDANHGWTRQGAGVSIVVNPEIAVAVSYPPGTPTCSVSPRIDGAPSTVEAALPATGVDPAGPLVLGGALLAGGGLLTWMARRRRARR